MSRGEVGEEWLELEVVPVVDECVVVVVEVVVARLEVRLLNISSLMVVTGSVLFGRLRVQLVKMVLDTSRGMMKMMRNEKYQAVRTANVTRTGCRIQLEYLPHTRVYRTTPLIISQDIEYPGLRLR